MKLSTLVTGGVLLQAAATVHAAPQLIFNDAADQNQVAFGNAFQSATLSWAHRAADKISQLFGFASTENAFDQWLNSPYDASNEDKTVWEIINESDEFRQLAHVLNYSSDSTKELLQSKDKQLTFFGKRRYCPFFCDWRTALTFTSLNSSHQLAPHSSRRD